MHSGSAERLPMRLICNEFFVEPKSCWRTGIQLIWEFVTSKLDLMQVDLLASGASLFWPRSGRPRATKSREVDLSRLQGFHLHFAPKMGGGVTRIWGFRFHCESLTSMTECPDSTPTKPIERVCVSPSSKEQICFLCAKVVSNNDFRRKLATSGGR